MPTDALLTLVGLVVAVIALLSPERRLDLSMRIRRVDWAVAGLSIVVVHYIKFAPVVASLQLPTLGPWRWGFDADLTSYLVAALGSAFVLLRLATAKLRPNRIGMFQNLCESLLFSGRFAELLFLLERHLLSLRRLVEGTDLCTRWRKRMQPPRQLEDFLRSHSARKPEVGDARASSWKLWAASHSYAERTLLHWLPNHEPARAQARRLMERVFLSEPFLTYLATARPYLGVDVLRIQDKFFQGAFLKKFIDALLKNRDSVLYEEVEQNQNIGQSDRYDMNRLNPLVYFFFGERFWAEELALYKPVGDAITEELERLRLDPADPYRLPPGTYTEDGRWRCPIFNGLRLFDFLVSEGLHRGIHWHLWLMYLETWTEGIDANLVALPPRIDLTREFPTRYHYLLYEIFSTLRNWITTAAGLDPKSASTNIDRIDFQHGSIAKSAVLTISACLRIVVESENVTPRFKGYLLDVVLNGYETIADRGPTPLAELYESAVLAGGKEHGGVERYRHGLSEATDHVDEDRHYMGPAQKLLERLKRLVEG